MLLFDLNLKNIAKTHRDIIHRLVMQDEVEIAFCLDGMWSREGIGRNFGMERGTVDRRGVAVCENYSGREYHFHTDR